MIKQPKMYLAVDCLIFGFDRKLLTIKILLIKRNKQPFESQWALPGGFVQENEKVRDAAARKLLEETGLNQIYFDEFRTYTQPGRDPRGRIISIAFYALIPVNFKDITEIKGNHESHWFDVYEPPQLAFDHKNMLEDALKEFRIRIAYEPLIFHLLPKKFSLNELQKIYELITNTQQDIRNFRKKAQKISYIKDLKEKEQDVSHRPAKLYAFDQQLYEQALREKII